MLHLKHDNDDYDDDVKDDGNDMMCNIVIHSCKDIIISLFITSSISKLCKQHFQKGDAVGYVLITLKSK